MQAVIILLNKSLFEYFNCILLLCIQKCITKIFDDRSLSKNLNSLHVVFRSGCGVALVGYMSGRETAQSLGCQQGVALMALSVCYIDDF